MTATALQLDMTMIGTDDMKVQPTTKELIAMLYERLPELFDRPAAQPAPVQEPVGDAEIEAWAERHDIQGTATDLRCMFEDAASFATPPAQPAPVQEPLQPVWNTLPSNKDVEEAMRIKRLNQLATPPAAQRQWVEVEQVKWDGEKFIAKLKEKNT